ncbi:MAG: hypothetical protein Fues2KO_42830 [Fuerstiella sp.]
MTDLRRYTTAAVVLLVVLRIALGWQLLYEGLWKISTLRTSNPWSAEGYLKNAVGPMRNTFREMAGDPDELGWLDYDTVSERWKDWAERFQDHYGLDKAQTQKLRELLYGRVVKRGDKLVYEQPLKALPEGVDDLNDASGVSPRVVWYDAKRSVLQVDADQIMTPTDKAKLDRLVPVPAEGEKLSDRDQAYLDSVKTLYERQKKGLGYLRRLAGSLKGDPDLMGNDDWQRVGKLEQYKSQLAEYEEDYAKASTAFEWDHLQYRWGKIQSLRAELTGPIKAMEADLKDAANNLLTVQQRTRGGLPAPMTALKFADTMTILGLTVLGAMLITGLFTRFAAVAAAIMLFNFYLAMPPLPGVPPIPGPEHSFIVNKNLIEVFALLALAVLPTGLWFGLDSLLATFFAKWKADRKVSNSMKSTVAAGDEPTDSSSTAASAT